MADDFLIIAITPEMPVADEAVKITQLLTAGGFDGVHLRHPRLSARDTASLVSGIPAGLRQRVRLHDHPDVAVRSGCGIHLNSRTTLDAIPPGVACSRSCHTLAEVAACADSLDYVTLSPIFDSISKMGYRSRFDLDDPELRDVISLRRVVALGGVTPERLSMLHDAGFGGAAMLGAIPWERGR